MKKIMLTGSMIFGLCFSAQAAVIIDSATGGDYAIGWYDGLGEIDDIYSLPGYGLETDTYWELTPTVNYDTRITAFDGWIVGDEFELFVSTDTGSTKNWTSINWDGEWTDAGGYYHGVVDYNVAAGTTYYFSIYTDVLALWPNEDPWYGAPRDEGFGFASFSGSNPVPEPATMLLFGTGIIGLFVGRRFFGKTK